MNNTTQQDTRPQDELPRVEFLTDTTPEELMAGRTLQQVSAVKFTPSGMEVLYDYNIPSTYNKYSTEQRSNSSTGKTEPWKRYGSDNRYPLFVLKLAKASSTLKRGYLSSAGIGMGKGLTVENDPEGVVKDWMKSIGVDGMFVQKMFRMKALFGGFYTLHSFTGKGDLGDGSIKYPLRAVELLPWHNCRPGKTSGEDYQDRAWVSADFSLKKQDVGTVYGYPYLPSNISKVGLDVPVLNKDGSKASLGVEDGLGKYVHYHRGVSLASDEFPDPHWEAGTAINAALLEAAISAFDVASIENGMTASYLVSVPFVESRVKKDDDARKDEIKRKLTAEMIGSGNAGKAVVMWSDPRVKGEAIQVVAIPSSNTAEIQTVLQTRKDRMFCTAFGVVDERLLGIPAFSGKGLSSQDNALRQAEDMWYSAVILPEITAPITEWFNEVLLPYCPNKPEDARIRFPRVNIVPRAPSDNVMVLIMTDDEIRDMYGLPPLTDEQRAKMKKDSLTMNQPQTQTAGGPADGNA